MKENNRNEYVREYIKETYKTVKVYIREEDYPAIVEPVSYTHLDVYKRQGVYGADKWSMAVDVTSVAETLYQGADYLSCLHIRPDAPPAFLLDAARMKGTARQPGRYDNRWCVFPQDAPSADFLKAQGIESIYVLSLIHI